MKKYFLLIALLIISGCSYTSTPADQPEIVEFPQSDTADVPSEPKKVE